MASKPSPAPHPLRPGKIDVNVFDRSVAKRLGHLYAGVPTGDLLAADPVTLTTKDAGYLALMEAAADIAFEAVPLEGQTVVLLPPGCPEEVLRRIEDDAAQAARELGIVITGGHTEVTSAVTRPVVTGIIRGIRRKEEPFSGSFSLPEGRRAEDIRIVAAGWTGLEGTYLLASEKEEELSEVFPLSLVHTAKEMRSLLNVLPAAGIAADHPGSLCGVNASEGGIFEALWKLSGHTGCGFDVSLPAVPIRQETIEITEHFGIDPYRMESLGCLLILSESGDELVEKLLDAGIFARVIGNLREDKDKRIINGGETRSLDRPSADTLIPLLY